MANTREPENELVDWAVTWLRERLPGTWTVTLANRDESASGADAVDAVIEVQATHVYATIVVEAKSSVSPRDVDKMLGEVGRRLRALGPQYPILVVAPWLSERTRDLLRRELLNYLDQTGNALIRLDNPAVFIEARGADRNPFRSQRAPARVRGPKAARLIRTLVDVRPPYGVRELAEACGLAPGYVSRLLDALDEDALVDRSRRGAVERADVAGLLRRWAATYDVFHSNAVSTYIAPRGVSAALTALADSRSSGRLAVTGSFAAVRLAPVAAPALLAVYCDDADAVASELDLLATERGTNVALLTPFDPVVWERTDTDAGVRYVAASQATADCLTGTGRMPAEGEALIEWMLENEAIWREGTLTPSARSST